MAITQAVANSFKKELLEGEHTFQFSGGDTFKLALYTSAATLNSTTTVYATNPGGGSNTEVPNSGEYAAAVLNFSSDKTATSGTFTIQFPAFTTAAAILRIGN